MAEQRGAGPIRTESEPHQCQDSRYAWKCSGKEGLYREFVILAVREQWSRRVGLGTK